MELDLFAIHMDLEQVVLKANYPIVNESMPYVQLRRLYFLPLKVNATYIAQARTIATSFRIHPYDQHMEHGGFISLIDAMRLAETWEIYDRLKTFFSIVQRLGYNRHPNRRSLKLECSMCEEGLEVISHLTDDGYGVNREGMFDDHIKIHVSAGEAHQTFICAKPDNHPQCSRVFGSRGIFEDHLERDHPDE
ncbi:hypothetical protein K505DRAFT_368329 [Melanomma pulvis-pyrius CBS 109.77]|uniref:Uncharacterized protein n=1 Tax=Melanomma pulvis-pyrius CBS 109.77 TaxID=1314802 RepID=A0A6A6WQE3_9PLEO|nr:hypothetical protein K505DRAFT_368329 [Melanomma pulvis-pyrius CBS 109.77]